MKITDKKVFHITLEFNIEADSATKALDQVLGAHVISPISFACEPICIEDDD